MTPEALLDEVTDRDSFLRFLAAMAKDHRLNCTAHMRQRGAPIPRGCYPWQADDIPGWLDRACAWAKETDYDLSENTWRACAEILLGGKHHG